MTLAYLNRVATAVPAHDVHARFVEAIAARLQGRRELPLFQRMARRAQVERRHSVLPPAAASTPDSVDADGFYRFDRFPGTAARMHRFEAEAPALACTAARRLELAEPQAITHLLTVCCTGFAAPGIDFALIDALGLRPEVERTAIGFMGCYAAINALKLARHIVRSDPAAQVLVVSVELCTLHLQDTADLEQLLSFLIFADGAAAALVSAAPQGFALDSFHAERLPATERLIQWSVRDAGFDMVLSGQVPAAIGGALRQALPRIVGEEAIDLWAVHPGGRSVLDAVEEALALPPDALAVSRQVLLHHGNMSSATVLFVLAEMLQDCRPGQRGCAMAFGPGLVAETMRFSAAP